MDLNVSLVFMSLTLSACQALRAEVMNTAALQVPKIMSPIHEGQMPDKTNSVKSIGTEKNENREWLEQVSPGWWLFQE